VSGYSLFAEGVALWPVLGEARNSIKHGGRLGILGGLLVTPAARDVDVWWIGIDDAKMLAAGSRSLAGARVRSMAGQVVTGGHRDAALTIGRGLRSIGVRWLKEC